MTDETIDIGIPPRTKALQLAYVATLETIRRKTGNKSIGEAIAEVFAYKPVHQCSREELIAALREFADTVGTVAADMLGPISQRTGGVK